MREEREAGCGEEGGDREWEKPQLLEEGQGQVLPGKQVTVGMKAWRPGWALGGQDAGMVHLQRAEAATALRLVEKAPGRGKTMARRRQAGAEI